jgi:two-component system, LytTR family, response regulator LytT
LVVANQTKREGNLKEKKLKPIKMEQLSSANDHRFNSSMQPLSAMQSSNYLSTQINKADKKSFLVYKQNKYLTIPTENIAFFYIKYDAPVIVCFDRQEFAVNYSLEQIQHLVSEKQFYRVNRQYLINFSAVKEVEHYFARKLLVNLIISLKEKLLVSKEKATSFLRWLENR